jgi:hypothetical protein
MKAAIVLGLVVSAWQRHNNNRIKVLWYNTESKEQEQGS